MKNANAVALGRLGGLSGGRRGGRARMAGLSLQQRRDLARQAAEVRWHGRLPELLRPLFWTYPTTFEQLNLTDDLDEVMHQVLAYGGPEHEAWLVRRFGDEGVRNWIIRNRGRGLTVKQMVPWVTERTARSWQAGNPGAEIWENR